MYSLLPLLVAAVAALGYAPQPATCPPQPSLIREGNSTLPEEVEWLAARNEKTDLALKDYLGRNGVDYSSDVFSGSNHPRIALAFSGGGTRAMLNGAGSIAALDSRSYSGNSSALGGVLQLASYIAALSGGTWLLLSLIFQNFPTVESVVLQDPDNIWNYTLIDQWVNLLNPLGLVSELALDNYQKTILYVAFWDYGADQGISNDLAAKTLAGYQTSITDAWGRVIAHSIFPEGTDNWLESATWSGIQNLLAFANHEMPFPLVTALARRPDSLVFDLNSPIVEFNPYEMGSFDTSINTFHNLRYLGTDVVNGVPRNSCVTGYDNAAFVVGTSLSLFNQFLSTLVCPTCNSLNFIVKYVVRRFLLLMSKNKQDIAWYKPNPFYQSEYSHSDNITTSDTLYLMDGGIGGEIVPLLTLATKERDLDVVFSFDNNGQEWPDGLSIINTYQKQFTYEGSSTVCPYVPGQSTFLHNNLTARPTFFGCDAKNLTALAKDGVTPPLVIYVASRPWEFYSNTSTLTLQYLDSQKKGMVANGFDVASYNNNTEFATCVGCAMVRRSEERLGVEQSEQCQQCFQKYCWDGSVYEDSDYYRPVNFTLDSLTNKSMSLELSNAYIHIAPTLTFSLLSLFLLSAIWTYIKDLF